MKYSYGKTEVHTFSKKSIYLSETELSTEKQESEKDLEVQAETTVVWPDGAPGKNQWPGQ